MEEVHHIVNLPQSSSKSVKPDKIKEAEVKVSKE
jgi:hypothetical protein